MPSPMMTQFYEIKKNYPNEILFFRLGDFYEMFADDAVVASAILEVVLTRRKNSVDGDIPMCGVPYHAAENYIAKLIQAGKSVAICEQGEATTPGSKLVNRAVVRVVTPGTVQLEGVVDQTRPNYIASIHYVGNVIVCALVDVSTGEMKTCSSTEEGFHERLKTYRIREVIYPESISIPWKHAFQDTLFVPQSKWSFDLARGWKMVCEHFGVASLEGFGYAKDDPEVGVAAAALSYVKYTQKSDLQHILEIEKESTNTSLVLDSSTLRNLEIFAPSHYSPNSKCVFDVVNDTKNPMGARFLRRTFQNPLTDISRITERQSQVQRFLENQPLREHTRQKLSEIMDIERVLGKLSSGLGGPRDLGNLRDSLSAIPFLKECQCKKKTENAFRTI